MQKKTYHIENVSFFLKKDFTVDESDKVQKILNSLYFAGDNIAREDIPEGDIKKFLSLVLEPEKPGCQLAEADFGKAKESVVLEIIKDFFLMRMRLSISLTGYFKNLMKESGMQYPDSTN